MRKTRRDMSPGTIFKITLMPAYYGLGDRALVVVANETEVDFWRGEKYFYGHVCPGLSFEVL